MPADLSLPVSRCPGIAGVAREVLGLDPWDPCPPSGPWHTEAPPLPGWPADWVQWVPVVPLDLPAGRLVAEVWIGHRPPWVFGCDDLYTACLYLGDLLRLCSALGVEVPAGTVPRLERAKTAEVVWILHLPGWHKRVDFVAHTAVGAEVLVPGLPDGDPRAALDAIVAIWRCA